MAAHARFRFRSSADLGSKAVELGFDLPFEEDLSALFESLTVAGRVLPNRLAVLPMEGADAESSGAPSEMTFRRYRRFAGGGSGLIWFEATAVRPDGRSNPRQLMLAEETVAAFSRLVEETRAAAAPVSGTTGRPLLILQLTHSGRFSKPAGAPRPVIAHRSPYLDTLHGLPPDYPLVTDRELESVRDDLVEGAELAAAAGFDGVDIKACHGYLLSELLAAHTRAGSRYGGPFENRTRLLLETVRTIRRDDPGLLLTSRMSATDTVPFPYGFGMDPDSPATPSLKEPLALVSKLVEAGVRLLAYSLGIPYWKPQYGRPFDTPIPGGQVPDEHPLEGVARHLRAAAEIQRAHPEVPVVGAGYTWLRRFFPQVAAAMVRAGRTAVVGLGRGALAYPDLAADLAAKGTLNSRKVCTTCSLCSLFLRQGRPSGCALRDAAAYPVA
jgi:2,4-dienoyl-CoA reductase-like NADH-dependent reductase (Old Yellow Enzyme family)